MKTRMTFRLPEDLASDLRGLDNQTQFVEQALRDALGVRCPACGGSGRVSGRSVVVPDFREHGLRRLQREEARALKDLTRIGWELGATEIELAAAESDRALAYRLRRSDHTLLVGLLGQDVTADLIH